MTITRLRLRFNESEIKCWACRYDGKTSRHVEEVVAPRIQQQRFLKKRDLILLAEWKSPRIVGLCRENKPAFIKAVTSSSFSTTDERLRVEVLQLLHGVAWPMASVILHFRFHNTYPILDVRALWSLGIEKGIKYDFDLWKAYVRCCRKLAQRSRVSMRTLDRALWRYSKEKQGKLGEGGGKQCNPHHSAPCGTRHL